jgi:uncharacterized SAM-binding protein YcdF (DUF218 family)
MHEIGKAAGYLLSPLTLVLGFWLAAALLLAAGKAKPAVALAGIGFAGLWLASTPLVALALARNLESAYPALSAQAMPAVDAIVVLGGSVSGRLPPKRPYISLNSASTRVWYAAELYRAGKARWMVIAAGGQSDDANEQVEADAIAEMLGQLGVPAAAMRLDTKSRNTRENAHYAGAILRQLQVRRVALVTSAEHMPRAMKTFSEVWANSDIQLIPAPTDVRIASERDSSLLLWIPSPNALLGVSKALKEYAGMAVLAMIGPVTP